MTGHMEGRGKASREASSKPEESSGMAEPVSLRFVENDCDGVVLVVTG